MRKFWDPVIRPILQAIEARHVIEIGSEFGEHSLRIGKWCHRHGARLDVIDPAPRFDVAAFEQACDGSARVHLALSLAVLSDLLPADVVLIDGDHNWYTVYHELVALYGREGPPPAGAPIAICHDVDWPYARRDLYYAPETVPAEFRQPCRQGSLRPDSKGLVDNGINAWGWHAEQEGGPRNGVRTAIEDVLRDRADRFQVVWLNMLFGLAIIVPVERIAVFPALAAILDSFRLSPAWKALVRIAEFERINAHAYPRPIAEEEAMESGEAGSEAGSPTG